MSKPFDPYLKWLGIREKDQPPTHYRLLGIDSFEDDPDVIEAAADRQMMMLRTKQTSQHRDLSQRLLNEVAVAKTCLLNPQQKAAYDQQMRAVSQPVIQTADPVHSRLQTRPAWQLPAMVGGAVVLLLLVGVVTVVMLLPGEQAEPVAEAPPADAGGDEGEQPSSPDDATADGNANSMNLNDSATVFNESDASPPPAVETDPPERTSPTVKTNPTPSVSPTTPMPTTPARPALAQGSRIDLLSGLDIRRDTVKGTWEISNGVVTGSGDSHSYVLELPHEAPEEYDLQLSVKLLEGQQTVNLGLPMGGRQIAVCLSGLRNRAGILRKDAPVLNQAEADPAIGLFPLGAWRSVLCQVRHDGLWVNVEGKTAVYWDRESGGVESASPPAWTSPNPRCCFLGCNATYAFRDVKLLPLNSTPAPEASPKHPLPEAVAVEKATTLIHEIYAGEFEAAETDAGAAAALIKKLREQTVETTKDETARYALLSVARELAIHSQAQEAAIALTRQIADEYEIERWPSIVETMQQLYAAARTTDERKKFVDLAARTIDEAVQDDALEAAQQIVEEGKTAALRARDVELRKQMAELADNVDRQLSIRKAVDAATKTLAENPDDPAANETLGRYLCLERGNWADGLAHLAKVGDPVLRELAAADLAEPEDPAKQADLGERWFDWASANKSDREGFLAAAHYWYERALPELSGLDKVRTEQRLKSIGKVPKPRTAGGKVQIASTTPSPVPSPGPSPTTTEPIRIPTDLQGGTAPALPKSNSPADQLAFNRAMAEWAIGKGGNLGILLPDGTKRSSIKKVEQLPNTPFMVATCHFTGKEIEDGDIPHLVALSKLELIALGANSLSNEAMAVLGNSRSLRYLRLGGTPLNDETLAQLCGRMPKLFELQVSSTAVTDQGLEAVGRLPALVRLYVAENNITDAGLIHLRGMSSLQNLFLYETKIDGEGLQHVGTLSNLTTLGLADTAVDDVGVAHLTGLQALKILNLGGTHVSDAGLPHIANLRSLEWLALSGSNVTGAGLSHLSGMPNLHTLYLRNLDIKDEDLAQLRGIPALREIYLGNDDITDAALEHLAQIPTLRIIGLEKTRVTKAGVERLQAALPKANITH